MSNDKNQLQQVLIQLAGITAKPGLSANPDLPDTWKSLKTETVNVSAIGKVQLLLAYGNVGDDVVACLSIGIPWGEFLGSHTSGFNPNGMSALSEDVTGKIPDDLKNAVVMSEYSSAYFWLRSKVWELLPFLDDPGVKGKPFYISGMSLGAPLAQIVGIDFRPNNQGPSGQLSPWLTQTPCYVFSAGNFASKDFQTYYEQSFNSTSFNYRAGSNALKVDQFPNAPFNDDTTPTYVPLGQVTYASIAIPTPYYTPWEVRDSNFYLKALGGEPVKFPSKPTEIPVIPTGFDQALSFALGKYIAQTYLQAQQPNNPMPSEMKQVFDLDGSQVVAALFEVNNLMAVVFRGSVTYQEFLEMDANSTTATVSSGDLLTSGVNQWLFTSDGEAGTLAQQLKAVLKSKPADKALYIIGHGFGGALANALAADIKLSIAGDPQSDIEIGAVYTFGASYFAGKELAEKYNQHLGAITYQVRRPSDTIATGLKSQPYFAPVDTLVTLLGSLGVLENTDHAMSSYLALLDPSRQ